MHFNFFNPFDSYTHKKNMSNRIADILQFAYQSSKEFYSVQGSYAHSQDQKNNFAIAMEMANIMNTNSLSLGIESSKYRIHTPLFKSEKKLRTILNHLEIKLIGTKEEIQEKKP